MNTENLKTAVAMAFEIFAKGETNAVAQVDEKTGNITDAAPTSKAVQKIDDPFKVVRAMLSPYAQAVLAGNASTSDRGIRFL
jgi:hypothetical protein